MMAYEERTRNLDVENIQHQLYEGYTYINEASNKDLVLLIGNTGAGKSTLCNYLVGNRMVRKLINRRSVIDTEFETDIKIGHKVGAETLFAKTVLVDSPNLTNYNRKETCLLDCPGFYGNRTIEERIIESVSTEMAIRNSRQVKGILILISLYTLMETRVSELRKLVKTLMQLFVNPVEMVKYSIFVITKSEMWEMEEAKQIAIGAIESLKDHCTLSANQLNNSNLSSSEGLSASDYDAIAMYFSEVLKHDNIVCSRPIDNGKSKQQILDRINGIKPRKGFWKKGKDVAKTVLGVETSTKTWPITIEDFNFSQGDEYRILFNKALNHLAGDLCRLMMKILQDFELVQNLSWKISDTESRLINLYSNEEAIEKELTSTTEKGRQTKALESIERWRAALEINNSWISNKQSILDKINAEVKELKEELLLIDTEKRMEFLKKVVDSSVPWWKFFGWIEMKFHAYTGDSDVPIVHVDKDMANGEWVKEKDSRNQGLYEVTYKSFFRAKNASASVKTYIRTKDDSSNKIRIQAIREVLEVLESMCKNFELEIEHYDSSNKIINSNIVDAECQAKGYEDTLRRELEECRYDISFYSSEIEQMLGSIDNAKNSGSENIIAFDKNNKKYGILASIHALLVIPGSLVKKVIADYYNFIACLDKYRTTLSESGSSNLESFCVEGERIFGLKDPITGSEIKDLVITRGGTAFDQCSLLQQFDTSMEGDIQPFQFRRDDGTFESIPYMAWNKMNKQQFLKNHSPSSVQAVGFSKFDIKNMNMGELEVKREEVLKQIEELNEQLELKKTELEKIDFMVENMHLNINNNDLPVNENVPAMVASFEMMANNVANCSSKTSGVSEKANDLAENESLASHDDEFEMIN